MRVGIGIPCDRDMPIPTVQCLVALNPVKDVSVQWVWGRGGTVDKQRAQIAGAAIEHGLDYLLFIDSDMTFPANTIKTLLETSLKCHAPIVTGVYFGRTDEGRCVVFADAAIGDGYYPVEIKMPEYPAEPFEVDYAGLGCCLIRVDLLKWMVDQLGGIDYLFHPDVKSSEDLSFFRRAKAVGAKVICEPSLRLGHIGVKEYTWANHVQALDDTRGCHHNLDQLAKQLCLDIRIDSFLDIGANDGNETEILRWRLGVDRESVVCAEPLKELAHRITKTYGFKVFNCAVGTKGYGELKLPSTGNSVMTGLNTPLKWEVANTRGVDILPACDLISDMNGEVFCRIDTEGSAYEVLRSFGDQIKRVKVFEIETEIEPMFQDQRLNAEVEQLLTDSGFDIVLRKPIWQGQVEVFAVRKD